MTRSERKWFYRVLPLLGCCAVGLMLLPGGGNSADPAGKATGPAQRYAAARVATTTPAIAARPAAPAIVTAAIAEPIETAQPTVKAVVPQPIAAAPLPAVAEPSPPGGAAPSWSAYMAPESGTAATPQTAALTDGQVGGAAVNVRAGPSVSAAKLFVLAAGEAVKLGDSSRGWVHVQRANGDQGWVASRYLAGGNRTAERGAAAPPPATRVARRAPVAPPPGPQAPWETAVRAAPNPRAQPVFLLEPGDHVRIAGARGNWLLVVTEDGMSGWIPT